MDQSAEHASSHEESAPLVGIDLGTTNSLVAVFRSTRMPIGDLLISSKREAVHNLATTLSTDMPFDRWIDHFSRIELRSDLFLARTTIRSLRSLT